jgi:hypothetical protein
MSGLVSVKKSNLPTDPLYWLGSCKISPSDLDNLQCCTIGILDGLHPNIPESSRISRVYFLWQKEMPFLDLATSKPKKYLKFPKSLSLNCLFRNAFN